MVPLRPRTHTIEEESERHFRDAVPLQWVVRKLTPDYGLDLTVEIFDAGGHSTPFSFHVQLKATDEEDVSKALRSIRFPRDLAEHYWSLPIPVLIVRYHAPSEQLYARWFHAYNPLVAARPDADADPEPSKTVGFVFTQDDAWTVDTPTRIVHAAESFQRYRSPDLALPLTFFVSLGDDADADNLMPLLLALRRTLSSAADVVTVRAGDPGPDRPHAIIGARASTIALADVASVTLDHDDGLPHNEVAAANLGCAIAIVLATVGQTNLAARVARACAAESTVITGMHAAFTLAGAFFRSQRIPEALEVVEELARGGDFDSRLAAFVLQSAVLARGPHLTEAEADRAVETARVALSATLADGDHGAAAGDAYNLGKALVRTGRWEEAVGAFNQAAELNADYENRPYFQADLAGSLFESRRYEEAVTRYERAIAIGDKARWIALLADSLMHAGRYADADARFNEYLAKNSGSEDGVWRLKQRVLNDVRSLVGDAQARRPDEANELADRIDFEDAALTLDDALALLRRSLEADALCGAAHNRRMFLSVRERANDEVDFSDAVQPAISAAVLHGGDVGAWVNAIRLACDVGLPDGDLYDLMRTGIRSGGQEVIDEVVAARTPPLSTSHLALLDKAAQDLEQEKHRTGFVLRVPGPEGAMVGFEFAPPERE